jgi:hypothetical protein
MDFTSGDWIQIVVIIAGFASVWGGLQARLKALEKKVGQFNNFSERMVRVETLIEEDKGKK